MTALATGLETFPDVLRSLLDASSVERLGWTLVHFVWEGAAVAALLAVALLALRRRSSQARHAAALAALLLIAASPAVTYVLLPAPHAAVKVAPAPLRTVVEL